MKEGDVLVSQNADDSWSAVKILAIDEWPDSSQVLHSMFYEPVPERPTMETVASLRVAVGHSPMAAQAYGVGWEVLCSAPVRDHELEGFHEYLKLTDFSRYVTATGQDMPALVSKAIEFYRRACAIGNDGERRAAIDLYTRAIDIFPLFHEAIDNRAFTYMELGDYAEALRGFEESLRANPTGNSAFFSRGECLMKLGMMNEAISVFEEGAARFPGHRDIYVRFLAQAREDVERSGVTGDFSPLREGVSTTSVNREAKPWWQLWRRK